MPHTHCWRADPWYGADLPWFVTVVAVVVAAGGRLMCHERAERVLEYADTILHTLETFHEANVLLFQLLIAHFELLLALAFAFTRSLSSKAIT